MTVDVLTKAGRDCKEGLCFILDVDKDDDDDVEATVVEADETTDMFVFGGLSVAVGFGGVL